METLSKFNNLKSQSILDLVFTMRVVFKYNTSVFSAADSALSEVSPCSSKEVILLQVIHNKLQTADQSPGSFDRVAFEG